MSATEPTKTAVAAADDPVKHMEDIGTALIVASEILREHADHIVTNVQKAVATLGSD